MNHPALFVISVGGVALGVTFLLFPWKSMGFGGSSFKSPFKQQFQLIKGNSTSEQNGNCEIINGLENVINKISYPTKYISVACENKGLNQGDITLVDRWVALFPEDLIKQDNRMRSENKKFSIKTITN